MCEECRRKFITASVSQIPEQMYRHARLLIEDYDYPHGVAYQKSYDDAFRYFSDLYDQLVFMVGEHEEEIPNVNSWH